MIYNIRHRTRYQYTYPVSVGDHVACLKPRSFPGNELLSNRLRIHPIPTTLTERSDYFGNLLCFFTIQEPHKELIVESRSQVVRDKEASPASIRSLPWEITAPQGLPHINSSLNRREFAFVRSSPRTPWGLSPPGGRCAKRCSS
jgi:hypothetical protein